MSLILPNQLPARDLLKDESDFFMKEPVTAQKQMRPLRIVILNLMPTKIDTETQLLRLLGNTAFPVEVTLMSTDTYRSKNTAADHLTRFYRTFDQIRDKEFDALIITGAPVEHLPFEQVSYWEELQMIMDWGLQWVRSLFYICWGAQAALYHQYGIPKYPLPAKQFGVYPHMVVERGARLLRGFDDIFYAPHSRHTEIRRADIEKIPQLQILAESPDAGIYIVATQDARQIFVTGHSEYDPLTLKNEYDRDVAAGLPIVIPVNYFPSDDPSQPPLVRWRGHAHLLFANWLNYYVFQDSPDNQPSIPERNSLQ